MGREALMQSISRDLACAQESVCATFGTGVSSACVVDVGDQKTSVCCVEDGLSQPATRLVMRFGGSDMTRCLHSLLTTRCGFPYHNCRLTNRLDAQFLQELKEAHCHLEQVDWMLLIHQYISSLSFLFSLCCLFSSVCKKTPTVFFLPVFIIVCLPSQ